MPMPYIRPCYCTNLRRASRMITQMYEEAFQPLGLSAAQYHLLINLSRVQPIDTTHLAQHLGLERSTVVRNMSVLQKNKWVDDLSNGSKHQFSLSKEGWDLLEKALPVWEELQLDFVQRMGQEDSHELMRLLKKAQKIKEKII